MIKITHGSSLALYRAAFKLRWRDGFFSRNCLLLLAIGSVLASLGAFAAYRSTFSTLCFNLAPFFYTLLILIPAFRFYAIRDASRNSRVAPSMSQENTIGIEADQIISVMPGLRRTAYNWDSVLAFAQNESVTVFRLIGHHLVFFPTPLTPEQRAELNDLVSRHGIRRWS